MDSTRKRYNMCKILLGGYFTSKKDTIIVAINMDICYYEICKRITDLRFEVPLESK